VNAGSAEYLALPSDDALIRQTWLGQEPFQERDQTVATINYAAAAEFYAGGTARTSRGMRYRRFASAAEAVQFVAEDMPPGFLKGSLLEVEEQRFEGAAILALYTARSYPLQRREAS